MNDFDYIKKACFTGYRPEKFPFKLNSRDPQFNKMIARVISTLEALIDDGCKTFYSGMAMGFDILCAECVLKLREKYNDINLICVMPYKNQESAFPIDWQQRYKYVLKKCDESIYISDDYHKACFQERNMFMVDNSDFVVCWYDGKKGGTRNTLKYAQKKMRTVININIEYDENFESIQTMLSL